ncbi:MAG TPA: LicD family protein [Oscillospiraceae bacterium]|nr:LicD family protein [Oscillospiraceae bacterium]
MASSQNLMKIMKYFTLHNLHYWLDGDSLRRLCQPQPPELADLPVLNLGLTANSLPQLTVLLPELEQQGYKIKRYFYQQELFLLSLHKAGTSPLQLQIYRPLNGNYYCLTFPKLTQGSLLRRLGKQLLQSLFPQLELAPFCRQKLFQLGVYLIPATYFTHFETLPHLPAVPVPHNPKEYLAQRYQFNETTKKLEDKFYQAKKPGSHLREQEYQTLTEILHRHQVPYCMDSGVLLGLMREGKLFSWEKDVDLQMWAADAPQFMAIIPELKALGWKVTLWYYQGQLYQFRVSRPRRLPVHIMLFRQAGEWAWCPASRTMGNPAQRGLSWLSYAFFSKLRGKLRQHLVRTDITRWPWKVRRQTATWWVPAHFFTNTAFSAVHQTYLPTSWDEYLSFRYGNWRVPARDWDFWVDDGAMRHELPDAVVDFKTLAKS